MSRILSPLNLTAGLWQPIAHWFRDINDRRALADMPDYLLRDIGLSRGQIDAALAGSLVTGNDTVTPAPARAAAEVVAFDRARGSADAPRPQKPMAA